MWGEVLLRTPVVSRCTQLPAVCWPACPFLVLLSCIGVPLCLGVPRVLYHRQQQKHRVPGVRAVAAASSAVGVVGWGAVAVAELGRVPLLTPMVSADVCLAGCPSCFR